MQAPTKDPTSLWKPVAGDQDASAWKPVDESSPIPPSLMQRIGQGIKGMQSDIDQTLSAPAQDTGWRGDVERIGQATAQGLTAPFVHPIQTAKGMAETSIPPVMAYEMFKGTSPMQRQGEEIAAHPREGLERLGGNLLGGAILGKGISEIPNLGDAMSSGAAKINNLAIGTRAGDFDYGANPGRAIAQGRMTGWGPSDLAAKVKGAIPEAAAEHRGIVANAPIGTKINAGSILTDPFDEQIANATDPRTGAANPAQVLRANKTAASLTHVMDPATGKVTPMMRDPFLSPLEATKLKSNIYGMADYDNPSESTLSNAGLKGAAHGLKKAVDTAVPESVKAGQTLHDLMAAKDILEPQGKMAKLLPSSKSGLINAGVTKAATTGAAGMDRLGSLLGRLPRF